MTAKLAWLVTYETDFDGVIVEIHHTKPNLDFVFSMPTITPIVYFELEQENK